MTETLLSPSNVLLFGRKVEDLSIVTPTPIGATAKVVRVATTANIPVSGVPPVIDDVQTKEGDRILVKDNRVPRENGIYVIPARGAWRRAADADSPAELRKGILVRAEEGTVNAKIPWRLRANVDTVDTDPVYFDMATDPRHGPFAEPRRGRLGELEGQLTAEEVVGRNTIRTACFARIYGFSYEGTYYELAQAALFLVHGEGTPASEVGPNRRGGVRRARAPGNPSLIGVATTDYQFADDLMVWSYDKADYTIRMDVLTGMFEDVLLPTIDGGGPGVSGARVSGARVSGARVSGARVSGARVSGARLSGSSD